MANPHPIPRVKVEEPFHPRDAVKSGAEGAIIGGVAGFFASAVRNSLSKQNVGAGGVFTRYGRPTGMVSAAVAVYMFTKDASANLRERDGTLNSTIASFLSGATFGLSTARMPYILGYGAAFSIIITAFEYTGGSLRGFAKNPEIDEFERKEALRLNRRRPIAETISEIGEGRGIEPPGYEERRRERLKEKYGFEVSPVKATVDGSS